ncbi:hypothetical protein [Agaribacterium haliotis]|uniref:hypothetical protein n=1 Tax=Agaribacterium haliotis TaxID=2013869 RepID=UPI000BB56890|nr:hypothetical protein [Agaribacterium haliotis]
MRIQKQIQLNCDINSAWQALAHDCAAIDQWFAPVQRSYALDTQPALKGAACAGRVCELGKNAGGAKAIEKITEWDEQHKVLAFDVQLQDAPALLPIRGSSARFYLRETEGAKLTLYIDVRPKFKAHAYLLYPLLLLGLNKSFNDLLKAFKAHVEQPLAAPV